MHAELASDPKLKGKRKTKGLPTSVREQQRQEQQHEVQERRRASKTAVTSSAVDARRVCVSLNDMHWPEEDEDGKERKKIYKKIKKVWFFVLSLFLTFSFFLRNSSPNTDV